MYRNLDEYLIRLEQSGELKTVRQRVRSGEQIAGITAEHIRQDAGRNRALWFAQVEGSAFPVVTNLFGTSRRMAWALGVDSLEQIEERLSRLIDLSVPLNFSSMMQRASDMLSVLRSTGSIGKNTASDIPVQQVQMIPDLSHLPISRCWPQESHASIPHAQLITYDPTTGTRRIQVVQAILHDQHHLALDIALQPHNQPLQAALVLGSDPATIWSAGVPLPHGLDPYWLAGWLRQRPVPLVSALSQPNLHIPSDAEIVIEGVITPGPAPAPVRVAYHHGFYADTVPNAIMKITTITHRQDAVYPLLVPLPPPGEHYWMTKAIERLFMPMLRLMMDDIIDLNLPAEGSGHQVALVRIQRRDASHARQIMYGLWGINKLALCKLIVVVDQHVDVQNISAVVQQIAATVDWRRDIALVDGPVHPYDRAALVPGFGGKLGIDATGSHDRIHRDPASIDTDRIREVLNDHWRLWQDTLLIAAPQHPANAEALLAALDSACPAINILLVDTDIDLEDPAWIAWRALASVDWRRDLYVRGGPIDPYDTDSTAPGTFLLDARTKDSQWPLPLGSTVQTNTQSTD